MSQFENHPILVLASASPRRAELLRAVGVPFVAAPVDVEEPRPSPEDEAQPVRWVERLASFKAERCGWTHVESTLVLAADTIVWLEGRILNKPRDEADAIAMLKALRGRTHTVYTGVCLRARGKENSLGEYSVLHEATQVSFGEVSDEWIEKYVATGESADKAGSYAAQGKGALLIKKIEGDFWNVVGLPLFATAKMLENVGLPVEKFWNKYGEPRS